MRDASQLSGWSKYVMQLNDIKLLCIPIKMYSIDIIDILSDWDQGCISNERMNIGDND